MKTEPLIVVKVRTILKIVAIIECYYNAAAIILLLDRFDLSFTWLYLALILLIFPFVGISWFLSKDRND